MDRLVPVFLAGVLLHVVRLGDRFGAEHVTPCP